MIISFYNTMVYGYQFMILWVRIISFSDTLGYCNQFYKTVGYANQL